MYLPSRTLVLLALSAAAYACARGSQSSDISRTSSNASVITRTEMETARYGSLYEVVQSLRGRWLQTRGPTSLLGRQVEVQVLVDDLRMGGVETLRSLRTDNVVTISFVDPVAAGQRWGGKYAQGTIVVITRADTLPQH